MDGMLRMETDRSTRMEKSGLYFCLSAVSADLCTHCGICDLPKISVAADSAYRGGIGEVLFQGTVMNGSMKEKFKRIARTIFRFLFNLRFLLCFGIGWIITNGWSYLMLIFGTWWEIPWMIAVATAYLTFLWLPVSPEKIVTVAIAMGLLRWLFPNDEKTLGILKQLHERVKIKKKRENKKNRVKNRASDSILE